MKTITLSMAALISYVGDDDAVEIIPAIQCHVNIIFQNIKTDCNGLTYGCYCLN